MASATAAGSCGLKPIQNCYVFVPGYGRIIMDNLPDLSDSKSASYSDTTISGRSFPLKTFSHSENRAISWGMHLYVQQTADVAAGAGFMAIIRALESAVYPANDGPGPYSPPPICQLRCGELLSINGTAPLNAVLKSYSVKFPTDVPWDEKSLTPYKIDIDLSFEVVYASSNLPGADRILQSGG